MKKVTRLLAAEVTPAISSLAFRSYRGELQSHRGLAFDHDSDLLEGVAQAWAPRFRGALGRYEVRLAMCVPVGSIG